MLPGLQRKRFMNISVVIPTYHRANKLKKAINSVLLQKVSEKGFSVNEIVIVDDCSDDNTEAVVNEIKKLSNNKIL